MKIEISEKIMIQLRELIKDKTVDRYYFANDVREYHTYQVPTTLSYENRRQAMIDGYIYEFIRLETTNNVTKLTKRMELSDLFNQGYKGREANLKAIFEQGAELKTLRDLKANLDKLKTYIKE